MRIEIDKIKYVIEEAFAVKQRVGRPRFRQARFGLVLRRPQGCTLYGSFEYHDGTYCKPFKY